MKNMILALAIILAVPASIFCHTIDISQVTLDVNISYIKDGISKAVTARKLGFDAYGDAVVSNEDGSVAFSLHSVNEEGALLEVMVKKFNEDKEVVDGDNQNKEVVDSSNEDQEFIDSELSDKQNKYIVPVLWGKEACGVWLDEEEKEILAITIVAFHGDHSNEIECDKETVCEDARDHEVVGE